MPVPAGMPCWDNGARPRRAFEGRTLPAPIPMFLPFVMPFASRASDRFPLLPRSVAAVCLLAVGAAQADSELAPYALGGSAQIQHESNLFHTDDSLRTADWLLTNTLHGGVDQAVGRDRLQLNLDLNRTVYKKQAQLDNFGYDANGKFDFSTVGDISGQFGADTARHQYQFGLEGDTPSSGRNIVTSRHVFANAQVGGVTRWTLYGGLDGNSQDYSAPQFQSNEERQWSANSGFRWQSSPDLVMGGGAQYAHGRFPQFTTNLLGQTVADEFGVKSLYLTTQWQATGNSRFNAQVGRTQETHDVQPDRSYWSGSASWTWKPDAKISSVLLLKRDSGANQATGAALVGNPNDLTGRSLNTTAGLTLNWDATAKIRVTLDGQYTRRQYDEVLIPVLGIHASGTDKIQRLSLAVHYAPTRAIDLSCSAQQERLSADSQLGSATPSYHDDTLACIGTITFR